MEHKSRLDLILRIPGDTFPEEVLHLYTCAMFSPSKTWFVELGTYQGRTLLTLYFVAIELGSKVVSIDNYLYNQPKKLPSSPDIVRNNLEQIIKLDKNLIEIIDSDSRIVPKFIDKNVGCLFIDTTHTKEHFGSEMKVWLPHLVKNGVVVCHDYNSPTWLEMSGAIDSWFRKPTYKYLGLQRRMIGFQKLS